jgi:Tol biopolymer transport system component
MFAVLALAACGGGDEKPTMAIGVENGGLYVVDGELEQRGSGVQPDWAPDGERLAFVRGGIVYVDDRRVGPGQRPQWTPDGASLVVERDGIRRLDITAGEEHVLARGRIPALSPDGSTVAFVRSASLYTVSIDGVSPRQFAQLAHPVVALQWLPSGFGVVLLEDVVRTRTARIETVTADRRRRVVAQDVGESFDVSPDGKRLAFTLALESGLSIARVDGTGARRYPLEELGPGTPMSLRWSPDSRELAFAVGGQDDIGSNFVTVYVLEPASGEARRIARVEGLAADIAWKPQP